MAMKTLALGGVAWNTMVYLDDFPDPRPQTVFARASHTTVGSSGAGKALNFASLGAEATLWALLGNDEAGAQVRRYFEDRGVALIAAPDPSGTMRHINLMDRHGQRISIFAGYGSAEYTVDVEAIRPLARNADLVAVTIMDYCRQFLPMLRELGKPVWIDIHDYDGANPYHDEFYEAADFLFMSSQAHPNWRGFLEDRVGAGTTVAVATHGDAGASGLTADAGWVDAPAVPVPAIVDSNGAGDAFFAGFALAWLETSDLSVALGAGAAQGARAVASTELAPVIDQ